MSHALIIDDNMIVGRAIANRLVSRGFESCDRAWARHQAVRAAAQRAPDVVVVDGSTADSALLEVARQIAASRSVPLLSVTSDRFQLERRSPAGTKVEGPFHIRQLDAALDAVKANRELGQARGSEPFR